MQNQTLFEVESPQVRALPKVVVAWQEVNTREAPRSAASITWKRYGKLVMRLNLESNYIDIESPCKTKRRVCTVSTISGPNTCTRTR